MPPKKFIFKSDEDIKKEAEPAVKSRRFSPMDFYNVDNLAFCFECSKYVFPSCRIGIGFPCPTDCAVAVKEKRIAQDCKHYKSDHCTDGYPVSYLWSPCEGYDGPKIEMELVLFDKDGAHVLKKTK
ncbi:MAG: hypothetical protein JW700_00655 [Candidatus Aenigmarchaeota archaeon]|nr:hypothetical protein [Candidatus Aenigmarchaeota archaeon]